MYNVPNDDYKKFRRNAFFELLGTEEYVDGATDYCLLPLFAEEFDLSLEQKLWLCYLYGMSYSQTTAMRFQKDFPTVDSVVPSKLKEFWRKNKESLWFNPDKKYLKNNDQVVPAIKSLYLVSGGNLENYLVPILKNGFDYTYKEIQEKWRFFGPHGAYLFFDALYGLCPDLYSDPENLDWKHCGKTVTDGMAHLLYRDDCVGTEQHDFEYYNKIVNKIQKSSGRPKVIIESTLCAFRKLFKQTRYAGFYADRMLEECYSTEQYLKPMGINVWKYRKKAIPEQFLGELHNWKGVRKELCQLFMKKGVITEDI